MKIKQIITLTFLTFYMSSCVMKESEEFAVGINEILQYYGGECVFGEGFKKLETNETWTYLETTLYNSQGLRVRGICALALIKYGLFSLY